MEFRSRPNSWVSQDMASTTQLTYALQLNPAPLTVSIPGEDPVLASLEFVITNPTYAPLSVQSVAFTMIVGAGASLAPTTEGITTAVSDTTNWNVVGPSSPITSGTATYTLEPVTGQSMSLAAGASVVVQLFRMQTNTTPGNSIITLKEMVGSKPGFTNFEVTTFPTGFYFNGLAATVQRGGAQVPVAQVNTGSGVTLLWNSSVVDKSAFTIYYSNASQGQQTATPTDVGEWTSGSLTSDTVFTVMVKVSVEGGQPLTASMSTAVSVQNPSLVAAAIEAGQAHVTGTASIGGALTANAVTATGLTVNGAISANSASISGALSAAGITASGANISGALSASSAGISGGVQAGSLKAATATITSALWASQGSVSLFAGMQKLSPGPDGTWVTFAAHTDGFVIGYVGNPGDYLPGCIAWALGWTNNMLVQATGGNVGFFGPKWGDCQGIGGNMFILPVQNGANFSIQIKQGTGSCQQADAPYAFYWVPLGTAQGPSAVTGEIHDVPPDYPHPSVKHIVPDDEPIMEFISLLEQITSKPIKQEMRDKLLSVLRLI